MRMRFNFVILIFVARINYENMFTTKLPDLRYMEYTVQTELLYNYPTHYISTCRILLQSRYMSA